MSQDTPSSPEYDEYNKTHQHKKKRVGKACDSCRIKKTKCDGKKPCGKCLSDNKICVFTEKRKSKDRHHPSGYVELLETRIDLLSKSLEKLTKLSTPYLAFLQNLQVSDKESIPINEVVSYLINKEGLLKNHPIEWENGALIAAKLPSDEEGIKRAAKEFAEHSQNLETYKQSNLYKQEQQQQLQQLQLQQQQRSQSASNQHVLHTQQQGSARSQKSVKRDSHDPQQSFSQSYSPSGSLFQYNKVKQELDEDVINDKIRLNHHAPSPMLSTQSSSHDTATSLSLRNESIQSPEMSSIGITKRQSSLTEQLAFDDDFSLGGFSSGAAIASSAVLAGDGFSLSEVDSDGTSGGRFDLGGSESPQSHAQGGSLFNTRSSISSVEPSAQYYDEFSSTKPWVIQSHSNGSVTSLTNKFENHVIKSPTATAVPLSTSAGQSSSTLRRASSITRAFSPSQQKMKNNSHVHKPSHSTIHQHTSNSSSNVNTEFRLNRINSNSSLSTPTPETFNTGLESPSTDLSEFLPIANNSLPSEAFRLQTQYDGLSIMDTENMETFLINNPFLARS